MDRKIVSFFPLYCRTWTHKLRAHKIGKVNTVGFEKGYAPDDAVALLREAIRKKVDDGKSMVVISGDTLIAFDTMCHKFIDIALESDLDIDTRIALMKQFYRKHAFLTIPGAGDTEHFPFTKGGWQGGINTPEVFNRVI